MTGSRQEDSSCGEDSIFGLQKWRFLLQMRQFIDYGFKKK